MLAPSQLQAPQYIFSDLVAKLGEISCSEAARVELLLST